MESFSLDSLLQFLSLLFCFIAVVRLLQLKLVATHPFFFAFLSIPLFPQAGVVLYGIHSKQFFHVWAFFEPLRNLSYILVVWELFSAVFRNYPGLRTLSRWAMGIAAVIAPVGLVLTFSARGSSNAMGLVMAVVRFERGIALGLAIFILILLYFISKYPIVLTRNDLVLCLLYSIWFLADAALLLILSFLPKGRIDITNSGLAIFEIASYIGCGTLLSNRGEYQQARLRQHITPERERALIGELTALNEIVFQTVI